SGAELTVGRVMAVKAMNMVSDATVDTVVYAYHSNKYDKDFTGRDIVKTWVKSAATSFAMQSVGGGKSSSKAESENGVISTGKGQGGGGGNVNWKNGKKTVDVNGKTVTMDKNTFDPGFVDKQGRTNTQRMEQGLAPIGTDGKSVNIHHIDQTDNGPVMEITATEHQQNYSKLHTNIGQAPSKINRSKFNKWRREYWKWRSNNLD
ncbi:HNH/ENDO VII family nuclease, partial [Coprococcus sp. RTP31081st1_H3_RTP31081_211007]